MNPREVQALSQLELARKLVRNATRQVRRIRQEVAEREADPIFRDAQRLFAANLRVREGYNTLPCCHVTEPYWHLWDAEAARSGRSRQSTEKSFRATLLALEASVPAEILMNSDPNYYLALAKYLGDLTEEAKLDRLPHSMAA